MLEWRTTTIMNENQKRIPRSQVLTITHASLQGFDNTFNFTSTLFVGFSKVSYDQFGFLEATKSLNLVPLAICLLTQMGQTKPVQSESKEEVLDDAWGEI